MTGRSRVSVALWDTIAGHKIRKSVKLKVLSDVDDGEKMAVQSAQPSLTEVQAGKVLIQTLYAAAASGPAGPATGSPT